MGGEAEASLLVSPSEWASNPWDLYEKQKILQGWGKKTRLGTAAPQTQLNWWVFGFLSDSTLRLSAGRTSNLVKPTSTLKTCPNKELALSGDRTKRGATEQERNIWQSLWCITEKQQREWEPRLCCSQTIQRKLKPTLSFGGRHMTASCDDMRTWSWAWVLPGGKKRHQTTKCLWYQWRLSRKPSHYNNKGLFSITGVSEGNWKVRRIATWGEWQVRALIPSQH